VEPFIDGDDDDKDDVDFDIAIPPVDTAAE
jgi:hypothetical protein